MVGLWALLSDAGVASRATRGSYFVCFLFSKLSFTCGCITSQVGSLYSLSTSGCPLRRRQPAADPVSLRLKSASIQYQSGSWATGMSRWSWLNTGRKNELTGNKALGGAA